MPTWRFYQDKKIILEYNFITREILSSHPRYAYQVLLQKAQTAELLADVDSSPPLPKHKHEKFPLSARHLTIKFFGAILFNWNFHPLEVVSR